MRVRHFSNHQYDQNSFEEADGSFKHELVFLSATLDSATVSLASGFPAVCAFVNDRLDAPVLAQLAMGGTKFVALRCAGYNNVDLGAAEAHGITVVRVPAYSPLRSPNSCTILYDASASLNGRYSIERMRGSCASTRSQSQRL